MKILLNGDEQVATAKTLADLILEQLGEKPRGVAIAVNDAVVPKSEWTNYLLEEGDRVEIVRAVQGG